jgi:hypothetical protein
MITTLGFNYDVVTEKLMEEEESHTKQKHIGSRCCSYLFTILNVDILSPISAKTTSLKSDSILSSSSSLVYVLSLPDRRNMPDTVQGATNLKHRVISVDAVDDIHDSKRQRARADGEGKRQQWLPCGICGNKVMREGETIILPS